MSQTLERCPISTMLFPTPKVSDVLLEHVCFTRMTPLLKNVVVNPDWKENFIFFSLTEKKILTLQSTLDLSYHWF